MFKGDEDEYIYGGFWMCKEFVDEIRKLENGYYNKNKYTKDYFDEKIINLVCGFDLCSNHMTTKQLEYRDELWKKYVEELN